MKQSPPFELGWGLFATAATYALWGWVGVEVGSESVEVNLGDAIHIFQRRCRTWSLTVI